MTYYKLDDILYIESKESNKLHKKEWCKMEIIKQLNGYAVVKSDKEYNATFELESNEDMYIILRECDGEELAKVTHWNDNTITVSEDGKEWESSDHIDGTIETIIELAQDDFTDLDTVINNIDESQYQHPIYTE